MQCYVVDAFADHVFEGNPAAVCVLERWPTVDLMQNIARENNLSETAFVVPEGEEYGLRWFTPGGEVDLCGHATLAAAYVILRYARPYGLLVRFRTQKSGRLTVTLRGDLYEMDLPLFAMTQVPVTDQMERALGARPVEAWLGRDLVCVMESEAQVRALEPSAEGLLALDGLLTHATAQGGHYDCVTRSFAPKLRIAEDPVCGSGHCHVVPYWAKRLGKDDIVAWQASARGGELFCRMRGDRVAMAGKATLYSVAELQVGEGYQD